jgi:signal peptidase II
VVILRLSLSRPEAACPDQRAPALAGVQPGPERAVKRKLLFAFLTICSIVTADVITKRVAEAVLPHGYPIERLGVPLTLAYNTGVAFGLPLPGLGRWLVIAATVFVLFVLVGIFRRTPLSDWVRLLAVQLVAAGALGNLIDRLRWSRGVVDFIGPIDLGFMDFPIFNVADMAITCGAVLLAISMLREDKATVPATAPALDSADPN